jgi:hypothetical protein
MFCFLVFDNDCPWTRADLGADISMQHMKFCATPVRDLFLVPPMTVMYLHHKSTGDRRKSIELAIMGGCQNGFHRFFYMGMEHFDELVEAKRPAFVYYEKAQKAFGTPFCDILTGHESRHICIVVQLLSIFIVHSIIGIWD